MSEKIVKEAAALRALGKNQEAIELVLTNHASLDEITRVPALLQALYAAESAGLTGKAKELALQISQDDPDVPSIRRYLS